MTESSNARKHEDCKSLERKLQNNREVNLRSSELASEAEMALKAQVECHCKLTSFSISIPSSCFPLKSSICHCYSCRHSSGQLFTTWAVIPLPFPSGILESGNLTSYEVSTCERWFCKRCGASLLNFDRSGRQEEWEVATGVLNFDDLKGLEGRLRRVQLWVDDVKGDGGAVVWVNRGKLEGMDRYSRHRGSQMVSDKTVSDFVAASKTKAGGDPESRLLIQCRCQTVSLEVKRPGKDYNDGTGRFTAVVDACTSCRTVTGFEVLFWTSIPKEHLVVDPDLGTFLKNNSKLGRYQSSADVSRYFCVTCGATVFYSRDESDTIDVAAGLWQFENVVRAEDWFTWDPEPGFQEEALDAAFVKSVADGMASWADSNQQT